MHDQNEIQHTIAQAKIAFDTGDFETAAEYFEKAANEFSATSDAKSAAEMANNCSVSKLKAGDALGALHSAAGTDIVFAEEGETNLQAMALGNQASALEALERYDEAVALYQQSSDLFKETGNDELRSYVLRNLSALQFRTGKKLEAIHSMQTALDTKKGKNLKERIINFFLKIPLRMLN